MRVSVVGLGAGAADWVTPAALARLHLAGARVFARTRFFPGLEQLLQGVEWASFDDLYERAASLDDVQAAMVERLLSAGDEVVLAVPGDGTLGEAILERLRARGVTLEVIPGVSLGVAALAAAGLPTADGAQFVEATSLGGSGVDLLVELNPRWPAAVTRRLQPAHRGRPEAGAPARLSTRARRAAGPPLGLARPATGRNERSPSSTACESSSTT